MGRTVGLGAIALGTALVLVAAGAGWLSWVEPHSSGIHPADRGPVTTMGAVGLLLMGGGVALLRHRQR